MYQFVQQSVYYSASIVPLQFYLFFYFALAFCLYIWFWKCLRRVIWFHIKPRARYVVKTRLRPTVKWSSQCHGVPSPVQGVGQVGDLEDVGQVYIVWVRMWF